MWKKYIIDICILIVMFFLLMFDKYILKIEIFGINISLYYIIILHYNNIILFKTFP